MKISFSVLIISIFVVFACTLPSAIEIRGTPEIIIPAKGNFSDIFETFIRESFSSEEAEDLKILICDHDSVKIMTFVLYMPMISEDNEEIEVFKANFVGGLGIPGYIYPSGMDFIVTNRYEIASGSETIELEDFTHALDGFLFDGIEAKLYLSGTSFVDKLSIDVTIGTETKRLTTSNVNVADYMSGEFYTFPGLPGEGIDVDLEGFINNRDDLIIGYDVSVEPGPPGSPKIVTMDEIQEAYVILELVVWLPLKMKAGPGGATLEIPDMFGEEETDLFGRESGDDSPLSDFLDWMEMEIGLDPNPFAGGELIISNAGEVVSRNIMAANSFNIKFDSEAMKTINETPIFSPTVSIYFDEDEGFSIPRNLLVDFLRLRAGLKYRIDL